jgi:Lon protease-like protein
MAAFHPSVNDLPGEFPIFPLEGALLLPRGRLPLNIFEPRYLAMTEDALGAKRMLGVIQPDRTAPTAPEGPGLFRVGCLGRLVSFSETEDGRFLVTLEGVIRFEIERETDMRRGYRRVRGDFTGFLDDLSLDPQPIGVKRDALIAALRDYFGRRELEANWDAIRRIPDDMLAVTLAMICPFEPAEKQALLEAPTPAERGSTLLALLRMGAVTPGHPASHTVS